MLFGNSAKSVRSKYMEIYNLKYGKCNISSVGNKEELTENTKSFEPAINLPYILELDDELPGNKQYNKLFTNKTVYKIQSRKKMDSKTKNCASTFSTLIAGPLESSMRHHKDPGIEYANMKCNGSPSAQANQSKHDDDEKHSSTAFTLTCVAPARLPVCSGYATVSQKDEIVIPMKSKHAYNVRGENINTDLTKYNVERGILSKSTPRLFLKNLEKNILDHVYAVAKVSGLRPLGRNEFKWRRVCELLLQDYAATANPSTAKQFNWKSVKNYFYSNILKTQRYKLYYPEDSPICNYFLSSYSRKP